MGDDDIDTTLYNIPVGNDFNTANPNILLIKVLRSHLPEVESRTQGSGTRIQKNFEAKAMDRPSRGQGQGPRTQTQVFSKQKKGLQKFFLGRFLLEETKKRSLQIFRKVSGVFQQNFNGSKIVLSSSRGQANFPGLEAWRPRPRTSKCVLKGVLEDSTFVICNNRLHNPKYLLNSYR